MKNHRAMREGIAAGFLGALGIALWFLVLDSLAGRPLFTPAILGSALLALFGQGFGGRGLLVHVALYTVFHFAVFIVVGLVAAYIMMLLDRRPSMLTGLATLFIGLELGFATLLALLSRSEIFGPIAWYEFGTANLIAALIMGRYLWRAHHPAFEDRWIRALQSQ